MTRLRRIVIVAAVVLVLGLPIAWAKSDPNTNLADRFEVRFVSSKCVAAKSIVYHPERYLDPTKKHLRLCCKIAVSDPNLLLGISRQGTITKFENDNGQIVEVADHTTSPPKGLIFQYQALSYHPRFVQQPRPSRFIMAVRSVLRLPWGAPYPLWVDELGPSRLEPELDPALLEPDSKEIRRIEGHFYVLTAASFANVDNHSNPTKDGCFWLLISRFESLRPTPQSLITSTT